ncbi:MAG: nitrogen fixation protein NifH [Theionarchaea archaeon]|nr:nitrogen fixation protein NifH [Theionarchaea archaeon]MBU7036361.1 nitrogen fixation protein NifH [Theionarchaea archaeon]
MTALDSLLKGNPEEWLLEEENPSVRYWTLRDIYGKDENDPDVRLAREQIMESYPVTEILKNQQPGGFWVAKEDPYLPKYRATHHQLLILSELGASPSEEIQNTVDLLFEIYQYDSGRFDWKVLKTARGRSSSLIDGECLTGNIVRALIHFGYLHHERTQKALQFLVRVHETGWPCRAYPIDRKKVFPENCYMGGVKPLIALSMVPEEERTAEMKEIIEKEVEIYLENEIFMYLKDERGRRKPKPGWTRFGFPLFYQSDALEVLDVLTKLGVRDERMQKAVDLVLSKQSENGRWNLENTFNGKMWVDIEEKGRQSKWITLKAVRVLNRFYR